MLFVLLLEGSQVTFPRLGFWSVLADGARLRSAGVRLVQLCLAPTVD